MSQRFRGAVIKATPPSPTSSAASAIWTLQQQAQFSSTWPSPPAPGPSAGGLWTMGTNRFGQLGQNDRVYRSSPTQVGALTTWQSMAIADSSAAIKSDGTLWTWGVNSQGVLGLGDTIYRSSPTQVGALTNWKEVVNDNTSWKMMFALKTDGTIWSWGYNYSGFLGNNTSGETGRRSSPVQIGALTTWADIGLGFAVKTDGTLWSWGPASHGRTGQNNTTPPRSSPVQIGALTNWSKVNGVYSPLAIKTDGTLWAWGFNGYGQLGLGNTLNRSSPTQVGALTNWAANSRKFSTTTDLSCLIKTDGSLWTMGRNNNGQLGQNDRVDRSSPVQVGTDTNWVYVAYAKAVKTDGTLWTWGRNHYGQLGLNNSVNRSSPTQVGALTTWQLVSSTSGPTGAIKT